MDHEIDQIEIKPQAAHGPARQVAPEDIREGMFVAISQVVHTRPPFGGLFGLDDDEPHRPKPEKVLRTPMRGVVPLRVAAVCLPYVHVQRPTGAPQMLDLRTVRLVRLPGRFAHGLAEAIRKQAKRSKRDD